MKENTGKFSAPQQALGYMFQPRYALYRILQLPEETTCLLEADDDVDFSDPEEGKLLASLKHKAPGDKLTDLSPISGNQFTFGQLMRKPIRIPLRMFHFF